MIEILDFRIIVPIPVCHTSMIDKETSESFEDGAVEIASSSTILCMDKIACGIEESIDIAALYMCFPILPTATD